MYTHASINRVFRLVWNELLRAYVPAAETARGRGKRANGRRIALALAMSAGMAQAGPTLLPSGAQVMAGAAKISTTGNLLTVQQDSERTAIDWQSFSIGGNASVDFVQPNAAAVVLNRVVGNEQSVIDGALHANGQVFLLNSSGILFGKSARVDTGGIVASTLSVSDADFMAARTVFSAGNSKSSLINLGILTANDGGYIALLGQQVKNEGVISARLGTAVLAAGNKVSLNFNGRSLLGVTVDVGALNALVDNRQAILADGGTVILTAHGLDTVMAAVVNNTGEIRAQSIGEKQGRVYLLGDMQSGTVQLGGTIDASAPAGGDGGFIETSAATVKVSSTAVVNTAAAMGLKGSWLVDPNDFTVAPIGGDITGAALAAALQSGDVTIQTTSGIAHCAGASCGAGTTGPGDINIDDPVTWSANRLTLNAYNNITINVPMSGSGTAGLSLLYGQGAVDGVVNGATASYNINAPITLPSGNNFATQLGSAGTIITYAVINSGADLQNINGALAGNFALGSDVTLSGNFTAIGPYTGDFEGLGHVISGLATAGGGLFSSVTSLVRDVGLSGANVTGGGGALVGGCNYCTITNTYSVNGTVVGGAGSYQVGGLVGTNYKGTITNSYTTGTVSGGSAVGGLVGWNSDEGGEFNSYSSATVTGTGYAIGGLVGDNEGATIAHSHASGAVYGGDVGGLVGLNVLGSITASYAAGPVTATGAGNYGSAGGLVGYNTGTIDSSFAKGNVSSIGGASYVGGLVGYNLGSISNTYALGNVSVTGAGSYGDVGGLIGCNCGNNGVGGSLTNSYATGTVTSTRNDRVNAVIGYGQGLSTATNNFWDTTTSQIAASTGGIGYGFSPFPATAATGLATADMKVASNFIAGAWDFTTPVWAISPGVNGGYPHLCAISGCAAPTPLYVQPTAAPSVYGTAPAITFYLANSSGAYVFVNDASATGTAHYVGAPGALSDAGSYSVNYATGLSLTGADASDYTLQPGSSATTLTVNPSPLSFVGSRTYNGLTSVAASAFGNAGTINTGIDGQTLVLGGSGSVASANVSAGVQTLTLGSLALSNGTGLARNYTLIGGTDTLSVSALPVTVTGTRPYNGTPTVALNLLSISNLVGSGSVSLGGTATLASADAGSESINLGGLTLSNPNYTLIGGNGTMNVTALPVTVAVVGGASRVYNGTAAAPSNLLTITNVINGDSVTLSGTATLTGSGVGPESLLSLNGLTLSNPDYTLAGAGVSGTVLITPASNNPGTPDQNPYLANATSMANATAPDGPAAMAQTIAAAVPNVVAMPDGLATTFGSQVPLSVVGTPDGNEPSAVVSLSQARQMLKGQTPAVDGGAAAPPDVRVPVSRNSLAEIVNGGVKLPSGVEQQLFVVKAN
jgi:filamentous hemagglutinin family protein